MKNNFNGKGVLELTARYMRDFFPGQPFKDNEWKPSVERDSVPLQRVSETNGGQSPAIVCTPSIDGAATYRGGEGGYMHLVQMISLTLIVVFLIF
jgi:hypothetical protein